MNNLFLESVALSDKTLCDPPNFALLIVIVHNVEGAYSSVCTSNTVSHEHYYLSVDLSGNTVISDINRF